MSLILCMWTIRSLLHQSRALLSITGAAALDSVVVPLMALLDWSLTSSITSLFVEHMYPTWRPATPKVLEKPQLVMVSASISGLRDAMLMCFLPSKTTSSWSSSENTSMFLSTAMSAMPFRSSFVITLPVGLWGLQTKMSFVFGVISSFRASMSNL